MSPLKSKSLINLPIPCQPMPPLDLPVWTRALLDGPKALQPLERAMIPTGIFIELPDGA